MVRLREFAKIYIFISFLYFIFVGLPTLPEGAALDFLEVDLEELINAWIQFFE